MAIPSQRAQSVCRLSHLHIHIHVFDTPSLAAKMLCLQNITIIRACFIFYYESIKEKLNSYDVHIFSAFQPRHNTQTVDFYSIYLLF